MYLRSRKPRYYRALAGDDYTTSKASDHGVESCILDDIVLSVSSLQTPSSAPSASTRLVDLLFANLEAPEMRDLPLNVLELASERMNATYPPEPMNYQVSLRMVRLLSIVRWSFV